VNSTVSSKFAAGQTFTFRVSAVNVIGEGPVSQTCSVIAADVPLAPTTPTLV